MVPSLFMVGNLQMFCGFLLQSNLHMFCGFVLQRVMALSRLEVDTCIFIWLHRFVAQSRLDRCYSFSPFLLETSRFHILYRIGFISLLFQKPPPLQIEHWQAILATNMDDHHLFFIRSLLDHLHRLFIDFTFFLLLAILTFFGKIRSASLPHHQHSIVSPRLYVAGWMGL